MTSENIMLFHRVAHSIAAVETRFSPSADIHDLEDRFFNLVNSRELTRGMALVDTGGDVPKWEILDWHLSGRQTGRLENACSQTKCLNRHPSKSDSERNGHSDS